MLARVADNIATFKTEAEAPPPPAPPAPPAPAPPPPPPRPEERLKGMAPRVVSLTPADPEEEARKKLEAALASVGAGPAPEAKEDAPEWTDDEQQRLDGALAEVPADLPKKERWKRIAALVGKAPSECAKRYLEVRRALLRQQDS